MGKRSRIKHRIHHVIEYKNSPLDKFDIAIQTVNRDRGTNYGHPSVNFRRIANLRFVTRDCPDPAARVALDEIAMKISRLIENPYHLDSWIDIAGYARAYVMVMQRDGLYPDNDTNHAGPASEMNSDNAGD